MSVCVNDTDGDGNCAACARNPEAPCRVSAREQIRRFVEENHNNLIDPWCDPETGFFVDDWEAHLKGLLDAYAHELAEQIRTTDLPEIHVDMFDNGTQWAADLIDPEVSS